MDSKTLSVLEYPKVLERLAANCDFSASAALARALALDPELLFLDEPTAGLDPLSACGIDELVRQLRDALGLTIMLVTHDSATVGGCASKLLYLDKKLIFYGTFMEFCGSEAMTGHFGGAAQHQICRLH